MTPHDYEQQLAAWLGDELTPPQRAAFEQACAADPERARELTELAAIRSQLRAGQSATPADPAAHAGTARAEHALRRAASAAAPRWLGFAAAILLAFAAGYLTRGPSDPTVVARPDAPVVRTVALPAGPDFDSTLVRRYAEAARRLPHASSLSRTWLAIASR